MTASQLKTTGIFLIFFFFTVLFFIGLGSSLLPLLISFALAYLFFPIIKYLETKKIPRQVAVLTVFIASSVVSFLVLLWLVPGLIHDAKSFIHELPNTANNALTKVDQFLREQGISFDSEGTSIKNIIADQATQFSSQILKTVSSYATNIFSSIWSAIVFAINISLIPVFFFHLVNNYENILQEIQSIIPIKARSKVSHYLQLCDDVLNGYVRGQMLVALCLATLYSIGFLIIGLRFGFLIGLLTGLLSVIPYVGAVTGFITAMTIAIADFSGFGLIGAILVVFAIIQSLEGLVITPKLVGNKVGLGILTTMLALIIGGNLLGLVGMFLAIPTAAILKELFKDLKQELKSSNVL